MNDCNHAIITGRLTRDPDGRRTNSGTSICNMGLAINRSYRDNGGQVQQDTTFVDVEVWGKPADFCRDYLRKGNRVLCQCRLKLDTWDDRQTGQKRSKMMLVAHIVQSLEPPPQRNDEQPQDRGMPQGQDTNEKAPPGPPPAPPFPAAGPDVGDGDNMPMTAPPDSAFPADDQPPNDSDAFEVGEESIDDIPFN